MEPKIFCGSWKSTKNPNYINLSIQIEKIKEIIEKNKDSGKKNVSITLAKRKEPGKYGEDWMLYENTFQPSTSLGDTPPWFQSNDSKDIPW